MNYFINIEWLHDLEKQEKWEKIRKMLYNEWDKNKNDSDMLIRLISECWYVLSFWDCSICKEGLSFQMFKNTLIECTEFGINNFTDNSRFLCITGYMISILPHLFYFNNDNDLFIEWEQKGIEMLRKSHELDPDDHVAQILNFNITSEIIEQNKVKDLLLPELLGLFPNNTAIEKYFIDILSVH